jgi:hypothetical protein
MVFEPIDILGEFFKCSVLMGRRRFAVSFGPSGDFRYHASLSIEGVMRDSQEGNRDKKA